MPQFIPVRVLIAAALSCLPAIASEGQVLSEWLNPVNGDWSDPLSWSTPDAPNNGGGTNYDVLIAAGGVSNYFVNLYANDDIEVDSITLDDGKARLLIYGSPLSVGSIDVRGGRIITRGTHLQSTQILGTGAPSFFNWALAGSTTTLENVRLSTGVRFITGDSQRLSIIGGLQLDDGVLLRQEVLLDMGEGSDLTTPGLATINLEHIMETANITLTPVVSEIASGITINAASSFSEMEGGFDLYGTFRADGAGHIGTLGARGANTFTNYGLIEAVNGGGLSLSGNFVNNATLNIGTGSSLDIEGDVTLGSGSLLTGSGSVRLASGRFDLGGQSFDINQFNGLKLDGGTLANGTITGSSGSAYLPNATESFSPLFEAITFDTDVHLNQNAYLFRGGLALLNGAEISSTIDDTDTDKIHLRFLEGQSISGNGRLRFGTSFASNQLEVLPDAAPTIFESGIFIDALNGGGSIGGDGSAWVSRGTIAVGSGQTVELIGGWSNEGTIILENDATVELAGNFTTADLGAFINQGGDIFVTGELDNTGQTLDLLFLPGRVTLQHNGTIRGGVIQSSGTSTLLMQGTVFLDRVTLDVTSQADQVEAIESLTINQILTLGRGNQIWTRDDSGDDLANLMGTGTLKLVDTGSAGALTDISPRNGTDSTLEIGAGLTILHDESTAKLLIGRFGAVTNFGTIDLRSGMTEFHTRWSNQGSILISDTAEVLFQGEYTTADLLSISYQGGAVRVGGEIDNTGAVLRKDTSTSWIQADEINGLRITNGRIETADELSLRLRQLDGVVLAGEVWLDDREGRVDNGLVFDNGLLHITDDEHELFSGNFSGTGTIQFDTGRFNESVLSFPDGTPFSSGITVQAGAVGGTLGGSANVWTNQATLRSFNAGFDLRVEGDVTHNGTAHTEDGGIITFAMLTNQGTLLAERGGILRLEDGWTNPTGQINVSDGGILAVQSWSAMPGTIALSEGVVRVEFDTDLAGLGVFPQQADSFLDIAGVLDLGGGTLDLDALASTLRLDGGTLLDGTVVGTAPLQITNALSSASTLDAIQVLIDVELGDTGTTHLRNATGFIGSTITGDGELRIDSGHTATFDAITTESAVVIDRGATLAVTNGLTVQGNVRPGSGGGATPRMLFTSAQTLDGSGEINASTSAGLQIEFTGDLTVGPDITLSATVGTLSLSGATHALETNGRLTVAAFRQANITAAQWDNHGPISINNSASLNITADTIINHGAIDLAQGNLNVGDSGITNLAGALFAGRGIVNMGNEGTFDQQGDLEVAQASNARLYFLGHLLTQDTASTRITFDNNHADTLAHIQATGDVALDGQLILDSESLFSIEAGDTLTLVLGDALTGVFDSVAGMQINPDLHWHLDYQADRLIAQARLSGDTSGDGFVDGADVHLLLANWGQAVTAGDTFLGEWSGDGTIGNDDLQVILRHWGQGTDPSVQIPEPGTLALLSMMLLTSHRRRKRA